MAGIQPFLKNLNLDSIIFMWASAIFLVITIGFLLYSVFHLKRDAIEISRKIKELTALLAEK